MYTSKPMMFKQDDSMETSINDAIKRGYFRQIRFLIEYGLDVNEHAEENRTPLMNCAFIDDECWTQSIAKLLLEKGAFVGKRDLRGMNAMHYACIYERICLVEIFLNALDFNLNAADRYGNTCLHYACGEGNVRITTVLVQAFRRFGLSLHRKNREGDSPLALACKRKHESCRDVILTVCPSDSPETQKYRPSILKTASSSSRVISINDTKPVFQQRPRTAFANLTNQQTTVNKRRASEPVRVRSAVVQKRQYNAFDQRNNAPRTLYGKAVQPKRQFVQVYRPASALDKRNKPEFFNESPLKYFVEKPKPENTRKESISSVDGGPMQRSKSEELINGNWREALFSYLNRYNYQFSSSYTKSAVPVVETDPTVITEEEEEGTSEHTEELDVDSQTSKKSKDAKKHAADKVDPKQKGKLGKPELEVPTSSRGGLPKPQRPVPSKRPTSNSKK